MNLWSLHCLAVKSVQRQSSWNISRMSKLFKCMACVHTILIALIGVCKLVIHLGSFNGSVRWTGRNLKPFSEQLEMMNKSLHRVLESRECFCEQWHFEFNDCLFVRCKVNLGTRMWLSAEICNTSRSWNKFVIEGLVLSYGVICSPTAVASTPASFKDKNVHSCLHCNLIRLSFRNRSEGRRNNCYKGAMKGLTILQQLQSRGANAPHPLNETLLMVAWSAIAQLAIYRQYWN